MLNSITCLYIDHVQVAQAECNPIDKVHYNDATVTVI
jgi:hypothetical protein